MDESLVFLLIGGVLAISTIAAYVAIKFNVPTLVAFLAFGMLLGAEGLGHIEIVDVELAKLVGTIGLIAILYDGGLATSMRRLRESIVPAALLSTVGVAVTAVLVGIATHFIFSLPWAYSMLVGAIVSSTDAAAVFATLRFTSIRRRLARILEAESGFNDPMAIALTIGFITWIQNPAFHYSEFILLLVQKLGIGLVAGLVFGRLAMYIFSHIPHSIGVFAPVISIAAAIISFGSTELIGGSGFLAVYMVGIAVGSTPSRYRGHLTTFHEGFAFVFQVAIFIILGLLVVPHKLLAVALPAILLTVISVVLIRPLAIWASLPFGNRVDYKEKLLLGWAGLRGAVPIVLATYVVSEGLQYDDLIFNIVFFVVLASTVLQGTTLSWVAKKLGVIEKIPEEHLREYREKAQKVYFRVAPQHAICAAKVYEVGLPDKARIIEIKRRGKLIEFDSDTVIRYADLLTVQAPYSILPELEDVFSRWRRRI